MNRTRWRGADRFDGGTGVHSLGAVPRSGDLASPGTRLGPFDRRPFVDVRGVAREGGPASSVAAARDLPEPQSPIDDGCDTGRTVLAVLDAAPRIVALELHVHATDGVWAWTGPLLRSVGAHGLRVLSGAKWSLTLACAQVVAVSYCQARRSRGVSLCDAFGTRLTLWSRQTQAFDDWLDQAVWPWADRSPRSQRASPGAREGDGF